MWRFAVAGLLAACAYPAPAQLTVPADTKISLRLTAPLDSRAVHPGDAVRARVAFPVTTGDTVAIPPGTYVEGRIEKVTRRGRHAGFQIRFTQLTYVNGYTAPLPAAADTRAALAQPLIASPEMANGFAPQQPQPFPKLSIDRGAIIGAAVGIAAIGVTTVVLLARRGHTTVLPAGAAMEITLTAPVTLDAEKVAATVALPPPQ